MRKIIVDTCGGDNPVAVIKGLSKTLKAVEDVILVAVGDKAQIEEVLAGEEFDRTRLEIVASTEIITNNDHPADAIMRKRGSSMVRGYMRLKTDEDCVAMISAGNTGALIIGGVVLLGRQEGIERPALATVYPTATQKWTCLLDCGANVDCKAHHLLSFAKQGAAYMSATYKIENPKIGLLSVGTEDEKGTALTKEAFALLKESGLNFVGNIEGKTLLSGECDVIVSDGYPGNVALKSIEGISHAIVKIFYGLLKKNAGETSDFQFVNRALGEFMSTYDLNSLGGAVLLGVKKQVVKAHGSANENTVVNVVKQILRTLS